MTRFNPKNNRFPYLAALFFGVAIAVTIFLDRPAPSPQKEAELPRGKNTTYHPFSDPPEYRLNSKQPCSREYSYCTRALFPENT